MAILSDEEAKAAQEVAKLGQQGVKAASDAGAYVAGTFRGAIRYVAMAAEDKAAGFFIRNRAAVEVKTRARLEQLGVDRDFRPIGERNYVPLLEAVSVESDETLQDVWAAYLANAMDPAKPEVTINRQMIEIIKQLEPADLPVLARVSFEELAVHRRQALRLTREDFPLEEQELAVSLSRLAAFGLFAFDNSGSVGYAPPEEWRKPCQLEIAIAMGDFRAQPLLLQLQRSVDYARPKQVGPA